MSKADYEQSRKLALADFPFYALLIAARNLAILNGDMRTADMINNCWSHKIGSQRAYDHQVARLILDDKSVTTNALLMTAMRQADTNNDSIFKRCWPELNNELFRRYHAAGGVLPEDSRETSAR